MKCARALVAILALILVVPAAASASMLSFHAARIAARPMAARFMAHQGLERWHLSGCHRKRERVVDCAAIVASETEATVFACVVTIEVRRMLRGPGHHDVASIASHACAKKQKGLLEYVEALPAIQEAADGLAGTSTTILEIYRRDNVTYWARARWQRPASMPTVSDPTETCSVEIVASLRSGRIATGTEGLFCF